MEKNIKNNYNQSLRSQRISKKNLCREQLVLYGVIALVIVVVIVILAFAFFNNNQKYNEFVSNEQKDICATPSGYTDQQWQEHMGHHPDRYAQCLKK